MNPKYIRVASDLHLEAFLGRYEETLAIDFLPEHELDSESILALAGDISSNTVQLMNFVKVIEHRFQAVFVVPGNHEYYRHNYDALNPIFEDMNKEWVKSTHSAGDVKTFNFDNVQIIFGALWADGGNSAQEEIMVGHYLNDFRLITKKAAATKYGLRLFTVSDMKTINAIHKNQIENVLRAADRKTVVITHHMPSYTLCHPRFGTECNGGFASHCDKLLYEDWSPSIWIHGHTHDTIQTKIGNTQIVCNPRGYRGEWSTPFNAYQPLFVEL
jgi:predicted MPP superfamily phosphohydrolase